MAEGLRQIERQGSELSLRALAKLVGVSYNAPYRHFADRRALLGALAAEGFQLFATAIASPPADAAPLAALKSVGLAYLGFARQRPGLYRLMFSRYGYSLDHPACKAEAERSFRLMLQAVAGAQAEGWRGQQDTLRQTLSFWAFLHGWASLAAEGLMPPDVAEPTWGQMLDAYLA